MLFSDIPFARLRKLQPDLGFVERVLDGKALGFYHPDSDTIFTFRLYPPQDNVSMLDLAGVRSQRDWRGLLSTEAFDTALRKASA
jgi:hypothetical protein